MIADTGLLSTRWVLDALDLNPNKMAMGFDLLVARSVPMVLIFSVTLWFNVSSLSHVCSKSVIV